MLERPEGAEIVRIRRERGKKGDIIALHYRNKSSSMWRMIQA